MPNDAAVALSTAPRGGLVNKFAARFGVEPQKMLATLKATAFRVKDGEVTNEQLMALLVVADQYNLNPWTRELFAFPDKGGIVPVVSVDGWSRIMNDHPQFDGMEFADGPEIDGVPEWIECTIYRKDRAHPIKVRERFRETKRANAMPWQTHPARMLRHKSMIQCARLAFGFAGIYDEDEARRIIEVEAPPLTTSSVQAVKEKLRARAAAPADVDTETGEVTQPAAVDDQQHPGLSYAEIATAIGKAETAADLDLCGDLIRSVKDESRRDELDAALGGRVEALAEKRKATKQG